MNVIMDACSIINLHNGGVLHCVCCIPNVRIQVGPIVGGECSEDCALAIASLHSDGNLTYLEDNQLEIDDFLAFVDLNKLGAGESECILIAFFDGQSAICCDDRKGRAIATELIGEERVMGSLRLLKIAVQHDILSSDQAFEAYELMCASGGFLPPLGIAYFYE